MNKNHIEKDKRATANTLEGSSTPSRSCSFDTLGTPSTAEKFDSMMENVQNVERLWMQIENMSGKQSLSNPGFKQKLNLQEQLDMLRTKNLYTNYRNNLSPELTQKSGLEEYLSNEELLCMMMREEADELKPTYGEWMTAMEELSMVKQDEKERSESGQERQMLYNAISNEQLENNEKAESKDGGNTEYVSEEEYIYEEDEEEYEKADDMDSLEIYEAFNRIKDDFLDFETVKSNKNIELIQQGGGEWDELENVKNALDMLSTDNETADLKDSTAVVSFSSKDGDFQRGGKQIFAHEGPRKDEAECINFFEDAGESNIEEIDFSGAAILETESEFIDSTKLLPKPSLAPSSNSSFECELPSVYKDALQQQPELARKSADCLDESLLSMSNETISDNSFYISDRGILGDEISSVIECSNISSEYLSILTSVGSEDREVYTEPKVVVKEDVKQIEEQCPMVTDNKIDDNVQSENFSSIVDSANPDKSSNIEDSTSTQNIESSFIEKSSSLIDESPQEKSMQIQSRMVLSTGKNFDTQDSRSSLKTIERANARKHLQKEDSSLSIDTDTEHNGALHIPDSDVQRLSLLSKYEHPESDQYLPSLATSQSNEFNQQPSLQPLERCEPVQIPQISSDANPDKSSSSSNHSKAKKTKIRLHSISRSDTYTSRTSTLKHRSSKSSKHQITNTSQSAVAKKDKLNAEQQPSNVSDSDLDKTIISDTAKQLDVAKAEALNFSSQKRQLAEEVMPSVDKADSLECSPQTTHLASKLALNLNRAISDSNSLTLWSYMKSQTGLLWTGWRRCCIIVDRETIRWETEDHSMFGGCTLEMLKMYEVLPSESLEDVPKTEGSALMLTLADMTLFMQFENRHDVILWNECANEYFPMLRLHQIQKIGKSKLNVFEQTEKWLKAKKWIPIAKIKASISDRMKLMKEDLLEEYSSLNTYLQLIYSPNFFLTVPVLTNLVDVDQLAICLLKIYLFGDCTFNLIRFVIQWEVDHTIHVGSLFRLNSLASKVMRIYTHILCKDYVASVCKHTIEKVIESGHRLEIDPDRLRDKDKQKKNMKKLKKIIDQLFNDICNSIPLLPLECRKICRDLKHASEKKFEGIVNAGDIAVFGYLILRLISPALNFPDKYQLVSKTALTNHNRRSLLLVSKILLNIMTQVTFTKEVYLFDLNDFIQEKFTRASNFLSLVSTVPKIIPKASTRPSSLFFIHIDDYLTNLGMLYNIIYTNNSEIQKYLNREFSIVKSCQRCFRILGAPQNLDAIFKEKIKKYQKMKKKFKSSSSLDNLFTIEKN